jgi:RNA polymerase-binding transcription factor DksA
MNEKSNTGKAAQPPSEAEIREHAYHLFEKSGRAPGRDLENWLKAEADLMAIWRETTRPIPAKWQWHYRTLLQIRDTLQTERTEHAKAIRTPLQKGEGGADLVDIASDECTHNMLLAEISLEDAELAEVEAALERIRGGTYGVCEITGLPISAARLRAIPWARRGLASASGSKAILAK